MMISSEVVKIYPFYHRGGRKCWNSLPGDMFHITGVDRGGKRFKIVTSNWIHASSINVWRGTRWLVRGGRRYVIQRIHN